MSFFGSDDSTEGEDISDYEKGEDDFYYDAVETSMSTVYTDANENNTDDDDDDDDDDFFEESSVKRRKMVLDCSDAEDAEAMSQPMAVRKSNSFC